jgi:hypothetical protein
MEIIISPKNFQEASAYIYNCPLERALRDKFPKAFILPGAINVIIIYDELVDEKAQVYSIPPIYTPQLIDGLIDQAKKGEAVDFMALTLTKIGEMENLFRVKASEDHVENKVDPFAVGPIEQMLSIDARGNADPLI